MVEASANPNVIGVITWCHTFSPAKMWIRGLEVLTKPLLQLNTQHHFEIPWETIDMDFMNLNQAAHGDREFGYILTRLGINRKIVVGHYTDPAVAEEIAPGTRLRRLGCFQQHEGHALGRQHAQRGRHRRRQDRSRARVRRIHQHLGRQRARRSLRSRQGRSGQEHHRRLQG